MVTETHEDYEIDPEALDDKEGMDYKKAGDLGLLDDPSVKDRIHETE